MSMADGVAWEKEYGLAPTKVETEPLVVGNLRVDLIDDDGDFQMTTEYDDGNERNFWISSKQAKQLIEFLQKGLDNYANS